MVVRPAPTKGQQLAHEIGALFLNFGGFEHTLSLAVAAAFSLNELQERTFVRDMFASKKVELLNAYAKKHWNDAAQKRMKALAVDAFELIEFRNDFAHGTVVHDAKGEWSIITFRGGDRFAGKATPILSHELAVHINQATRLAGEFQGLEDDIKAGSVARPK